jgi:hypothetical protein
MLCERLLLPLAVKSRVARPANNRHTRACGVSSTPRLFGSITDASEYWVARSSRAMTAESAARVPTPSLRAQAKQSMGPRQERMDCFVALLLAMTWLKFHTYLRVPAALIARVLQKQFAHKTEGAGNAGRSMHPQPRVRMKKAHEHSHHGHTGNTRHSPRNGFTAYAALFPATNSFLSPSPAD